MNLWNKTINSPGLTNKSITNSASSDSASLSLPLLGHWKLNTPGNLYIIPQIPSQPTAGGKATLSQADFKTVFWVLIASRTPSTDTFWLKRFPPVYPGISAGQKGLFWIMAPNYFLLYPSVSVANLASKKKKRERKNVLTVPEGIYHPSKELQ